MINRIAYSPSFQKKLVAKVDLPSNDGVESCSIYELNSGRRDARKLKKQLKDEKWSYKDNFIWGLKNKFNIYYKASSPKIFSIENGEKDCLGLLRTYDCDLTKNIEYLEVSPKCRDSVENRNIKNIGSALMTYFLKSNKGYDFVVLNPVGTAQGFYEKMGFEFVESFFDCKFQMQANDVSQKVNDNEQRIGSKIELVV